ncbi:MAG: hypothetical protein ACO1SV_21620 [Fimbriimonas sp.]
MKRCFKCKAYKPNSAFHRSARQPDGLQPDCKACKLAYMRERYRADPERFKVQQRAWNAANRDRVSAYNRQRVGRARRG